MAGGAGLSGGIGKQFGKGQELSGSQMDKLKSMSKGNKARTTRRMRPSGNAGRTQMRSASAKRLAKMQGAMSGASAANPETAAATHSEQWENSTPTTDAITGAGASGIDGGGASGSPGAGLQNGGPTDTSSSGSSGGAGDTDVPDTGPGTNMTPYQSLVDMAIALIVISTIISIIIAILAKTGYLTAVAVMLCKVNVALGVIVALLGLGIMMYGQAMQGGLFTLCGTLMAVCSYAAIGGSGNEVKLATNAAALSVASAVIGLLGASGAGLMGGGGEDSGGE
ncbi:hypothetical protein ACFL2T_06885 [Elusimicrobiota bacterium]